MSGLLNAPAPRRRSKAAIKREKEELMEKLKALELEEKQIDPFTDFACMREDILFVNFEKIRFGILGIDYECDRNVPDEREIDPTYFCASSDRCRSDVIDQDDCLIDKAIARCKENAENYNKAVEFFEAAKQRGAKYVVDGDEIKPEDFEMEE